MVLGSAESYTTTPKAPFYLCNRESVRHIIRGQLVYTLGPATLATVKPYSLFYYRQTALFQADGAIWMASLSLNQAAAFSLAGRLYQRALISHAPRS